MSIRNAVIAMRQRKIELFEQERLASMRRDRSSQDSVSAKGKKKGDVRKTASAQVSPRTSFSDFA